MCSIKVSNEVKYLDVIDKFLSLGGSTSLVKLCDSYGIKYSSLCLYIKSNLYIKDIELYNKVINLTSIGKETKTFDTDKYISLVYDYINNGGLKSIRKLSDEYNLKISSVIHFIKVHLSKIDRDLYDKYKETTNKTKNTKKTYELSLLVLKIYLNLGGELKDICETVGITYTTFKYVIANKLISDNKYYRYYKISEQIKGLKDVTLNDTLEAKCRALILGIGKSKDLSKSLKNLNTYDVGSYSVMCYISDNKRDIQVLKYLDNLYGGAVAKKDIYCNVLRHILDNNLNLSRYIGYFGLTYMTTVKFISRYLKEYDNELYTRYKQAVNKG